VSLYILAGEKKKKEILTERTPELGEKGDESGNEMDIEGSGDMEEFVDGLDKGIYDLELCREIGIESGAEMGMIENVKEGLAEKIES
ncbi:toxic anion resistance protein, partial [Staphylococcus epidermidis]|uniref:toxic anion resistance protein n=1 Tax=Staphylococcus epidermidis TaxID=1282 RepID=UPI0016432216